MFPRSCHAGSKHRKLFKRMSWYEHFAWEDRESVESKATLSTTATTGRKATAKQIQSATPLRKFRTEERLRAKVDTATTEQAPSPHDQNLKSQNRKRGKASMAKTTESKVTLSLTSTRGPRGKFSLINLKMTLQKRSRRHLHFYLC